jgi:hypothetical protein
MPLSTLYQTYLIIYKFNRLSWPVDHWLPRGDLAKKVARINGPVLGRWKLYLELARRLTGAQKHIPPHS